MKIGVGFCNGIGNFIIFTAVLRAIIHHAQESIDLILNENRNTETMEAVRQIASKMKDVNIVNYPSEFDREKYDKLWMSVHSIFSDPVYQEIMGFESIDLDNHTFWATSFLSEYDFYYIEIMRELGYKGPLFPQYMPYDKKFTIPKHGNKNVVIANGYQRTDNQVFKRKQYPHMQEVIDILDKMYNNKINFHIVGGEEDREWTKDLYGENIYDHTGRLNILETANVVRQSSCIICNDSSVFHIADALRSKGVVLFGSTLCSKNGPLNGTIVPIRSPLKEAPCQKTVFFQMCGDDTRCMDAISPSYVIAAVRKIMR